MADGPVLLTVHPRAVSAPPGGPPAPPARPTPGGPWSPPWSLSGTAPASNWRPPLPLVAEVAAAAAGRLGLSPAAAVWVTIDPADITAQPA